jgi:hypothetical protein
MLVFWVVVPCLLVGGYQRFREHTASIFSIEVRSVRKRMVWITPGGDSLDQGGPTDKAFAFLSPEDGIRTNFRNVVVLIVPRQRVSVTRSSS